MPAVRHRAATTNHMSQALDWWRVSTLPLNTYYNHGMRIQQDSRGGGTWGRMEGRRRMTVSSFFASIRFCFSPHSNNTSGAL